MTDRGPSVRVASVQSSLAPPVRVICVDAHPLFTLGVRAVLASHQRIHLLGEAASAAAALRFVDRAKPDVLLLDIGVDRGKGLDLLGRLQARKLPTRTILIASDFDANDLRIALIGGARGVLHKHAPPELLVKSICQVAAGEIWIGRQLIAPLVEALINSAHADTAASALSHRERDIVDGVIKGASNKIIGAQLGLGEQTVKNHLRRIFSKLGVANRVELAVKVAEGWTRGNGAG